MKRVVLFLAFGWMVSNAIAFALMNLLFAQFACAEEVGTTARTLLFVDDHDVLYRSGTRRELHPLTRQADNPLLTGETAQKHSHLSRFFVGGATSRTCCVPP